MQKNKSVTSSYLIITPPVLGKLKVLRLPDGLNAIDA
jgi:hypothetical protein